MGVIEMKIKKTVREVYKELYEKHFKYLTKNHMAVDRASRLAVIYAVKNTWKEYNK